MNMKLKIAVAQFNPVRGDLKKNYEKHYSLIMAAVEDNVDVIVFPELSLTGYEPDLAKKLVFADKDRRLVPFQELAVKHNITIIVGAPVVGLGEKPQIGSFVISPDSPVFHYSKMHLHPGEDIYFEPGKTERVFQCQGQILGLAICADTGKPEHAQITSQAGATIYLSSVLITASGYDADTDRLKSYTKAHGMAVFMANFCGMSGGWNAIGKSAIWGEDGLMLSQASENEDALVIGMKTDIGWVAEVKTICDR